ncbi:hypothetical protein AT15_03485 [Kosmotoga arenicorallina S304]|uniref:Methyltransferase n=1 Tax=Kosmotoga arenicorallina S304 TaxID=1453497 RepID=A0A182C820_9BACT|nr:16S rRNA (guanine(966)-N(2))-methyltransferase RsmD [Kosmotoga arenicorallina]OAA31899.1 hypothetical protein AT15_03485 [Kosmotoga arenicorallina S304]
MLSITGGIYKGRKIETTPRVVTRYTPQMTRKALFDIIDVAGKVFLDLFAGSGIMGIEALSRGAQKAIFVDSSRLACGTIKKNLELLKITPGDTEVYCRDFRRAIPHFQAKGISYDIVFADPPFEKGYLEELLKSLIKYDSVIKGGVVVVEAPERSEKVIERHTLDSKLKIIDTRKYAGVYLYFMKVVV